MRKLILPTIALLVGSVTARAQLAPWYNPFDHQRSRPASGPQRPSPLTVGAFVSVGLESHDASGDTTQNLIPLIGLFADYGHHVIRPGIDVRGQYGNHGVVGTLIGPRVSARYAALHPYAEALFGPNHYEQAPTQPATGPTLPSTDHHGVTAKAAFGVDIDFNPNLSWRLVEYTIGTFNGLPGSTPQTFTTGLVFHIP